MTADAGYTVDDLVEAETSLAVLARAHGVVVAADHLVWGRAGFSTVIPLAAPHVHLSDLGYSRVWVLWF